MKTPNTIPENNLNGKRKSESVDSLFRDLKPPLKDIRAPIEASRCLECGGPTAPAPCILACPTGIDIPGFISAIYRGEIQQAAETIYAENILGATCAKVCPVETLCEGACVLSEEGRKPVEIGRLQRYATESALSNSISIPKQSPANNKKVAIIGAGPGGLSCAAELAKMGYKVTVYDQNKDFGGLIRYAIAPYRIMRAPLTDEVRLIKDLGVNFRMGEAVDTPEKLKEIEQSADSIFLGIGLGKDVKMNYPGEELTGVWDSLDFIRLIKTGPLPDLGDKVAVIGGGNTAIDAAIEAKRLGAHNVTIFYRRTEDEMPAYDHEIEEARNEGINFQFLVNPVRFHGDKQLQHMECQYIKLGPPDASGRPRPKPVEGTEFRVPVDAVIKAIGQQKRTGFLSWIDDLTLDNGLIQVDRDTGQATNPKYFAGGDALNGGATVVEAVQDGKKAAKGIHHYLAENREFHNS